MDWQTFRRSGRRPRWPALGLGLLLLLAVPRPLVAEDSLAGHLLVATPQLSDPNFSHTVIYILRHDETGALGLVINRPMGEVPLNRVLAVLKGERPGEAGAGPDKSNGKSPDDPLLVFFGGPVEPYRTFTLHSRDVMPEHSVPVDAETAFNAEGEVLEALAKHAAPKRMIFALGYSGWAAGQLENEVNRGDWYVVAADPTLVFNTNPDQIWEHAVALFSTDL